MAFDMKEYNKRYYLKHKEKWAKKNKKYFTEEIKAYYKEYARKYYKRYYLEHKEDIAKNYKRYYQKHRENLLKKNREYYEIHKERILKKGKIYRERYGKKYTREKVRERKPWTIYYYNIRARCYYKKHVGYRSYGAKGIQCCISKKELKQLWFRDEAYKMIHPSIHRKDHSKNYTFENCEFIEWVKHRGRPKKRNKNKIYS